MPNSLIIIKSTRAAIRAERFCQENTIPCSVVSTPEQVSAECGISLQLSTEDIPRITAFLDQEKIGYQRYDRPA